MVSIDICPGLWGKVSVVSKETKEVLWEGKSGQKAEFEVTGSMPVELVFGILQKPGASGTVIEGESYDLVFRMKPFGSEYYLIRKEADAS